MRGRACILTPVALWCAVLTVVAGARAQETIVLVGSGSSVPAPLYARWAQEYKQHNSRIQFRYLATATKEGIEQISKGNGDFGAGEMPLALKERAQAGLTEIPVALVGLFPSTTFRG